MNRPFLLVFTLFLVLYLQINVVSCVRLSQNTIQLRSKSIPVIVDNARNGVFAAQYRVAETELKVERIPNVDDVEEMLHSLDASYDEESILSSASNQLNKKKVLPWLVKLKRTGMDNWIHDVEEIVGHKVDIQPVDSQAFGVLCDQNTILQLSKMKGIIWIGHFMPSYRVDSEVKDSIRILLNTNTEEVTVENWWVNLFAPIHSTERRSEDIQTIIDELVEKFSIVSDDTGIKFEVAGPNKLLLQISAKGDVSRNDIYSVMNFLTNHKQIVYLEKQLDFIPMNKYAHWVTQSNMHEDVPFWDAGLHGENEIVGCGDTGVDYDLCYFSDSSTPFPLNTVSSTHRKFVTYVTHGTKGDYFQGHGTHVVGSIAGDWIGPDADQMTPFNGMAPKAKLAFSDIAIGQTLVIPDDLNAGYFPLPYNAGARIHSNSWGADMNVYSSSSVEVDHFSYYHPDFLPLFASGNIGYYNQLLTVGTPATSKNCIAVGASQNAVGAFAQANDLLPIEIITTSTSGVVLGASSKFGPSIHDYKMSAKVVWPNDTFGCGVLDSKDFTGNSTCIVIRGFCYFTVKVKNCQNAGAMSAIVLDRISSPFVMYGTDDTITIPSVSIAYTHSEDYLLNATEVVFGSTKEVTTVLRYGREFLADFSSKGPTLDLRFKPDIVAPGDTIFSAESDGSEQSGKCEAKNLQMSGTSMATPIMAGTLALVRQYFTNGWYLDTGLPIAANASHGFAPPAALMKAVVLNGAQALTGGILANDDIPSFYQGYGKVNLANSAPLPTTDNSTRLFVRPYYDDTTEPSLDTGSSHDYCFMVAENTNVPFKATLVWTDPPAAVYAAAVLINDLDLIVSDSTGDHFYVGNDGHQKRTTGQCASQTDIANNVEQVEMTQNTTFDSYRKVTVVGSHVPIGPQKYSIAVSGDFQVVACSNFTNCPNGCSGNGFCDGSICACHAGYYGVDCSQTVEAIPVVFNSSTPVWTSEVSLSCDRWYYYKIDRIEKDGNGTALLGVHVLMESSTGDPDLYTSWNSFPTRSSYVYADTSCNSCWGVSKTSDIFIPWSSSHTQNSTELIVGVFGYWASDYPIKYKLRGYYSNVIISPPIPTPTPTFSHSITDPNPDTTTVVTVTLSCLGFLGGLAVIVVLRRNSLIRQQRQDSLLQVTTAANDAFVDTASLSSSVSLGEEEEEVVGNGDVRLQEVAVNGTEEKPNSRIRIDDDDPYATIYTHTYDKSIDESM